MGEGEDKGARYRGDLIYPDYTIIKGRIGSSENTEKVEMAEEQNSH